MKFTIETVGSVPANDFIILPKVIVHQQQLDIAPLVRDLVIHFDGYKRVDYLKDRVPGEVIFPGETISYEKEIQFEIGDNMFWPGDKRILMGQWLVVGAFYYRSPLDLTPRYTTFAYSLFVNNGTGLPPDQYGKWSTVEMDKIKLAKWFTGWTAT